MEPEVGRRYVELAIDRPHELEAVESILPVLGIDGVFGARLIRRLMGSSAPAAGTVQLCLNALAEIGALEQVSDDDFQFDQLDFESTAPLRKGIRIGLDATANDSPRSDAPRLVGALPPTLDQGIREVIARDALDLRVALIDLIASAQDSLVLASPFWDRQTTEELSEALRKRLEAGVSVAVLGRSTTGFGGSAQAFRSFVEALEGHTRFRGYVWEEQVPEELGGTRTFHFKTAIVDRGGSAYLGTANFTSAGLRSRFELGVLVGPREAEALYRLVGAVLRLATRVA